MRRFRIISTHSGLAVREKRGSKAGIDVTSNSLRTAGFPFFFLSFFPVFVFAPALTLSQFHFELRVKDEKRT